MREDILKPASTRSKIVVSLKEPKDANGKTRAFLSSDEIIYELDPYDKVRMRLLVENEKFYKAYERTIEQVRENINYQPMKRRVNCCLQIFYYAIQYILLLICIYFALLVIQLSLFNLVIMGILIKIIHNLYGLLDSIRWKLEFTHKTDDFKKFIDKQNNEVY